MTRQETLQHAKIMLNFALSKKHPTTTTHSRSTNKSCYTKPFPKPRLLPPPSS